MILDTEGYRESIDKVMKMEPHQLLEYLDKLYGRENLPRSCTVEDIRNEALAQTERRFGPDYEHVVQNRKRAFAAALVRNRGEVPDMAEEFEDEFEGLDSLPSTA